MFTYLFSSIHSGSEKQYETGGEWFWLSEFTDFMFLGEGWVVFDIANPNSKMSYGLFFEGIFGTT